MRKQILVGIFIVITISFIFTGCVQKTDKVVANNIKTPSTQNPVVSEMPVPTPVRRVVKAYRDRPYYSTIKKIADKCQDIIIGKVEKILPVVRISISAPDAEDPIYCNYTPLHIMIEKTVKGDKKEGDYIDIVQDGGTYTGITENKIMESVTELAEDVVYMKEGEEYLIFVRGEDNVGKDLPYYYYLPSPDQGYCRIVDGKCVPNGSYSLFKEGMSVDEAIKQIEESQISETSKK